VGECEGKAKGFIQTYSAADGNVVVRGLRIAAGNLPLLLTARMNQHFFILTKEQSRGVTTHARSGSGCTYVLRNKVRFLNPLKNFVMKADLHALVEIRIKVFIVGFLMFLWQCLEVLKQKMIKQ
jgi:FMN-dependent NADH-azoreductase